MLKNDLREYRYSSIFFILVAVGIIAAISEVIIGEDSDIATIITGIVGSIGNFIIFAGLLNTRMGSVSDYLSNIRLINLKVIVVNLVVYILLTVIGILLGTGTIISAAILSNGNMTIYFVLFVILLYGIFYILTAHINFVLSDRRFRNLGFIETLGLVIKTGIKLAGKTLVLALKYYLVPILLVLFIVLGGTNGDVNSLAFLLFGVLAIYLIILVFLLPGFVARLSDIYLDYIEENYPYEPSDFENDKEEDKFYLD